jgi:hypothetical protein
MKRILILILFTGLISSVIVQGQVVANEASAILEKLYGSLVNNYNDSDRIRIDDSIVSIIDSYVRSDTVFNHRFSNLKYLGQITSSDSTLKIVTWNIVLSSVPGIYHCYFIKKRNVGKENSIYSLSTSYHEVPVRTDTIYTGSNWYGALYYDLKHYRSDNNQYWILLGIDYGNPEAARKIIDVVSFSPDDSIVFGRKFFDSGYQVRFRDVFEYAANGMMSLRFNTENSIVFDHLVPFSPAMKDDRRYYGPDYSSDAYIFQNGLWHLKINVDARNKE